ncbi:DM13 domain-containing protein [Reichenbachiella sp. MALMAid0571]|uniref:DM13 domain-containing protein n=1 Tax=Reichenbachiella sp. MALMAid0571 TaxID=3143939 RepID=UPI0032E0173C
MKKLILMILATGILFSCGDDEPTIETIDTSMPQGTFTASKSGTFTEQNDTGSAGTAELGTDEKGTQFLHFGSNFTTNLGTGTVTVYLSTSDTYMADPGNGNPDLLLIAGVKSNGDQYFKLDPAADSKFTYVILWCGSASIPFGYAQLQ